MCVSDEIKPEGGGKSLTPEERQTKMHDVFQLGLDVAVAVGKKAGE